MAALAFYFDALELGCLYWTGVLFPNLISYVRIGSNNDLSG